MKTNIVENGEKFWFAVLICKEDLLEIFEGDKLATKLIEKLSDDDMANLANRYGDALMSVGNWTEVVKEVFKDYEKEYKKNLK